MNKDAKTAKTEEIKELVVIEPQSLDKPLKDTEFAHKSAQLTIDEYTEDLLPTFYAWTAGIVDGEGCIGIYKRTRLDRKRKYIRHQLKLSVKMTHKETILILWKIFGGNFRQIDKVQGNRKVQYNWEIGSSRALWLLRKLYPYLITKKDQAELAISFQGNLVKAENKLKILDKGNFAMREFYTSEIKKLNMRGKVI